MEMSVSLAGGTLGVIAVNHQAGILLFFVGAFSVIEASPVILQVVRSSCAAKRIFRMGAHSSPFERWAGANRK